MNVRRQTWFLYLIVLIYSFLIYHNSFAATQTKAEKADELLTKIMYAMELNKLQSEDVKQLSKLTKSTDEIIKIKAVGLYAQFLDEYHDEPLKALQLLAPYILKEDALKQFNKDISRIRTSSSSIKKVDAVLEIDFPSVSEWELKHPDLCIQAARVLTSFNQYQTALDWFDTIGRNLEGIPRVLASEGGGDTVVKLHRYQQAIEFYDFAVKTAEYTKQDKYYGKNEFLDFLITRIRGKRNKANRLLESEKYGPEFIMYRDARTLDLNNNDYLRAAAVYAQIEKEFPNSLFRSSHIV